MARKLLTLIAIASLLALPSTMRGQSRVRFGRNDGGLIYGSTPPPLDPYAMPPQSGVFGGTVSPTPISPQPMPPTGYPGVVDPAFTTGPPAQFPSGIGSSWGNSGFGWPDGMVFSEPMKRLQGPRFQWAWLPGNDGRQLQVHEFDTSIALAFPNFFGTMQPLYILPSFSLELWDGPKGSPQPATADLPGQTYAAFVDAGWESDRAQTFGAELGLRVGVWSDFNTMTSDSLRIQGKGLARFRVTPKVSIRAGVIYVDRVDVKILPAGGILWEPHANARYDFYFPNPKVSHYWTTLGNQDLWWYLSAKYGGDSWTIERAADGMTDRFDYNDIRIGLGLEWGPSALMREARRIGFAEIAWVLDREVIYARRSQDNFRAVDTVMLQIGFGY